MARRTGIDIVDPWERLFWGPVLETRDGCRARIDWLMRHAPLDLMAACGRYDCTPDGLVRLLHRPRRPRRKGRPRQMGFGWGEAQG